MGFFNKDSWRNHEVKQPTLARCGLCGLTKSCFSPKMVPCGSGRRKILFLGSTPTEDEDKQGTHFTHESGGILRDMLDDMGVDMEDCWIAYSVLCRPPKGKIEIKHIEACLPTLLKFIQEHNPNVIITLGSEATQSLLRPIWQKDMGEVDKWVGWKIPIREYDAWVCPVYHPQMLLDKKEDVLLKRILTQHLQEAIKLEKKPIKIKTISQYMEQIEIIKQPHLIKARIKDLLKKEGSLAFDYETTGLKPEGKGQEIVSVSFCLDGEDCFAFPWVDSMVGGVSRVLQKPTLTKIASNMKFEERWTRKKLGHGVSPWEWDTMQAAHCLDNRTGVTSIKFQAFVHLGIGDYSSHISSYLKSESSNELNRIYEVDMDDLLMYNGLDSVLEYHVAKIQQKMTGIL